MFIFYLRLLLLQIQHQLRRRQLYHLLLLHLAELELV
jgi:hypothetical protein